jgi:large subunit ribosomal protein L4
MATVDIVASGKKKSGTVALDPSVFEAPVKPHLFHAEVRRQLAKRQRGTHSTRNRSAVSGGGKKPWRQKGTGRARQGSIRSPQWAGGGAVFGPVPRSHEHALPRKVRAAALRGALSLRFREGALAVADSLVPGEPRTREVVELLRGLGVEAGQTVLLVVEGPEPALERGSRNLPWAHVLPVAGLNTYDVLRYDRILVSRPALDGIHARLAAGVGAEESP